MGDKTSPNRQNELHKHGTREENPTMSANKEL